MRVQNSRVGFVIVESEVPVIGYSHTNACMRWVILTTKSIGHNLNRKLNRKQTLPGFQYLIFFFFYPSLLELSSWVLICSWSDILKATLLLFSCMSADFAWAQRSLPMLVHTRSSRVQVDGRYESWSILQHDSLLLAEGLLPSQYFLIFS